MRSVLSRSSPTLHLTWPPTDPQRSVYASAVSRLCALCGRAKSKLLSVDSNILRPGIRDSTFLSCFPKCLLHKRFPFYVLAFSRAPTHSKRTVWTYLPQNIGSYFGYRHISRDVAITEGAAREDGKSTDLRRCRRWPDAGDSRLWRQRCVGGAASAHPRPGPSRSRRASGTRHTWTRCSRLGPGHTWTWRSGPGRTRTRRALLPLEALARWLGGVVAGWQHRPSQVDPPMVVEVLQGNTIHNHYVTVTK